MQGPYPETLTNGKSLAAGLNLGHPRRNPVPYALLQLVIVAVAVGSVLAVAATRQFSVNSSAHQPVVTLVNDQLCVVLHTLTFMNVHLNM